MQTKGLKIPTITTMQITNWKATLIAVVLCGLLSFFILKWMNVSQPRGRPIMHTMSAIRHAMDSALKSNVLKGVGDEIMVKSGEFDYWGNEIFLFKIDGSLIGISGGADGNILRSGDDISVRKKVQ